VKVASLVGDRDSPGSQQAQRASVIKMLRAEVQSLARSLAQPVGRSLQCAWNYNVLARRGERSRAQSGGARRKFAGGRKRNELKQLGSSPAGWSIFLSLLCVSCPGEGALARIFQWLIGPRARSRGTLATCALIDHETIYGVSWSPRVTRCDYLRDAVEGFHWSSPIYWQADRRFLGNIRCY